MSGADGRPCKSSSRLIIVAAFRGSCFRGGSWNRSRWLRPLRRVRDAVAEVIRIRGGWPTGPVQRHNPERFLAGWDGGKHGSRPPIGRAALVSTPPITLAADSRQARWRESVTPARRGVPSARCVRRTGFSRKTGHFVSPGVPGPTGTSVLDDTTLGSLLKVATGGQSTLTFGGPAVQPGSWAGTSRTSVPQGGSSSISRHRLALADTLGPLAPWGISSLRPPRAASIGCKLSASPYGIAWRALSLRYGFSLASDWSAGRCGKLGAGQRELSHCHANRHVRPDPAVCLRLNDPLAGKKDRARPEATNRGRTSLRPVAKHVGAPHRIERMNLESLI